MVLPNIFLEKPYPPFFHFLLIIFFLNKVVLPRRFRFYFVCFVIVVFSTFDLSSFYRRSVARCFVTIFDLCRGDSDR